MSSDELANAVLTVDLAAIAANWRKLRDMAAPAKCAAVVKADAYGLGVEKVAPALAAAGCELFYVAQLEEGISLRKTLASAQIAVFDGVVSGSEVVFDEHRLIPVLNDLGQIELWNSFASRAQRKLPAIMHIDTGLNRLGLPADESDRVAAERERLGALKLLGVISHLACSDEPRNPMNALQLERFSRMRLKLPSARAGIAASSAIFLGTPYHLDEVRPGASLYGVAPLPGEPNPMAQVIELNAKILQVRDVDSAMTVGYGATYRPRRPSRIATVGVGYADGYFRTLGNSGEGYVEDHSASVVGRISMDLITLDVTDVPTRLLRPGARVELLGRNITIDRLASQAGTIGYEILTSLGGGKRFRRRYVGGEGRD